MKQKEITEIIDDIREAFLDIGTLDEQDNVQWYCYIISTYDNLYKEDVSKEFKKPVSMVALATSLLNKDELEAEGLDYKKTVKLYITADYFSKNEIIPKLEDRVLHRGILYDVVKVKAICIADSDLLYAVFVREAELTAQSEEHSNQVDSLFTHDATKPLSLDLPAKLVSATNDNEYEIISGINDKLKISINDETAQTFTLVEGTRTKEQIVAELQSKFDLTFGLNQVIVNLDSSGHIVIETIKRGTSAKIEIYAVQYSCYLLFGFRIGIYQGSMGIT